MDNQTNMNTNSAGTTGPDSSWRILYRAGGITAILYIVLAVVIPAIQVYAMNYDFHMGGEAYLQFIGSNKAWWIILQTLVLGSSILAIITFAALYAATKHLNKSFALIGNLSAGILQLLFMAYYPVLLGLTYLSDQYKMASDTQQGVFVTAAESLIAMNNAFNPLYESLFAVSILIVSLVMLKGVFHKSIAYLGIVTFIAAITAMSLWSVVNVDYLWWWIFFVIWFTAVGIKLFKLGRTN